MDIETAIDIMIYVVCIIIVFVFAWGLYQQQQLDSAAVAEAQNP